MKKLMVIAVVAGIAVLAGTTYGASLKKGTKEIQVSGNYDPDAADDYSVDLLLGYGVFIVDNLEVGARGQYSGSDHVDLYGIQGLAEYNFDLGSPVVPFVGATVGWLGGKVEDDTGDSENNDVAAVSGLVGAKYFITETVALAVDAEYTKASDDIFADSNGDVKDDDLEFNLSLRFYIP